MIKVSVIIPTYNREKRITTVLRALENQTFQDFEVVVAVDGSTDNTLKILRETPFQLQKLKVAERPNGGRSAAKNSGVEEATGDLLIFLDDDMRPAPTCIASHVAHHQSYSNSICVGTQTNDPANAITDIQKFWCALGVKWEKNLNEEYKPLRKDNLYLTSANFSILKQTFHQICGFDDRIGDREDYEMATRAFKMGVPIYFNRNAFSFHDDPITCLSYVKRQRESYQWSKKIKALKGYLVAEGFMPSEEVQLPWYKQFIFRLFANKLNVWLIDHWNIFLLLPKSVRYKIYDVTVTGLARHYVDVKID